ncbi:Holliday junction resolvase RuvX [[Mycoplasma] mobile]|uniref:Putative pre-16S rRNA nuclease n=1 Tax=Mycoplasma mobile (strain ATCC 43663 / 163K / NCTC 11711) TaxID=267748 RepID=YQGF_MYCM1|nr:Holliday junction resolvase RuvX [[Mycoplasma] mobile]Q6KHK6.1 RecName: Full=Putative pre-16S rRNA nuclease [Mycoplasma mobile 163K]AAT27924.1 hypothetical endonuclease [Mycoplasma mobile 163K]
MRKLGIDLGKIRTGFAISDDSNKISLPLKTFIQKNANFNNIILEIKKILLEYQIDTIVIGLPIKINNEKTKSTIFVENFKKHLEKEINLPIFFVNEYNSSVLANLSINEMKSKKRKTIVDKISAQIILNDFLNNYFIKEKYDEN